MLEIPLQAASEDDNFVKKIKDILTEIITKNQEEISKLNEYIEGNKKQVQELEGELKEDKKALQEVDKELRRLVEDFQAKINRNKKVIVKLLVENHSNLKNGLYKTAVITFYKDNNTNLPILLYITHEDEEFRLIDGNGFKTIKLESRIINSSQERQYEFIKSAFENEYSYIVVVQDLNDKTWYSEGKALSLNFDVQEEILKQETLKILRKRFE